MAKKSEKEAVIKTLYGTHTAVLKPDEKGFVVVVPGLPGVVTWGKNLKHAKKMAKEAIELCVECVAEERLERIGRIAIKTREKVRV